MSGVYIVEFFFPDDRKNVIKIGCSKSSVEKRIFEIFKSEFSGDGGYTMHSIFPCDKSTCHNLEAFIINMFISKLSINPLHGREYFTVENRDVFLSFLKEVDSYILEFFESNKIHSTLSKNIGSLIRSKRKVINKSQSKLGLDCNLRQATISDIENGKIGTFKTPKTVCDYLSLRIVIVNDDGRYI